MTFARASPFLPGHINIHRNLSTSFLVAQLLPLETSSYSKPVLVATVHPSIMWPHFLVEKRKDHVLECSV